MQCLSAAVAKLHAMYKSWQEQIVPEVSVILVIYFPLLIYGGRETEREENVKKRVTNVASIIDLCVCSSTQQLPREDIYLTAFFVLTHFSRLHFFL